MQDTKHEAFVRVLLANYDAAFCQIAPTPAEPESYQKR